MFLHLLVYASHFLLCSFPGVQRPIGEYGPSAAATAPSAKAGGDDDDDDFDLFGDDDDDDEEVMSESKE